MIVTGGHNVYPREVEDAWPCIRRWAGASADEPRDVTRQRLAGYKVPKRVVVVDAIPKSLVGKILRRALRDPLWTDSEGQR